MKFLVFATFFGISFAICDFNDCQSCAGDNNCLWDLGTNKCEHTRSPLENQPNMVPQPLSCPASLPAFRYTDDFGRNIAFPFAMASNAEGVENVTKCPAAKIPTVQVLKQYTVGCDFLNSSCSATLFFYSNANALVLAFRGSKGTAQFTIEASNLISYGSKTSPLYDGKVFSYFANAIELFWNGGLAEDLRIHLRNNQNTLLWVFGHSLGGSLATLAANAAVKNGFVTGNRVVVTTMGEPRTGDYDFASDVTNNVPQTYRIVKKSDLITKIPVKILSKQTNAYHNNFEVWYNNNMTVGDSFVINNRADDYSGSNAVSFDGGNYHNSYFDVDMDNYVENQCSL
ncbi:hypothetical protein FO519_006006 [Halicephalobus sp. NKZ332]|nr:hypothetical protein FO519_006006 [Halicephalobus sp. NKZ332]